MENEIFEFYKEKLIKKFDLTETEFDRLMKKFNHYFNNDKNALISSLQKVLNLENFKVNENIFEKSIHYDDNMHLVLRLIATVKMESVFKTLLIDLDDPNVKEDLKEGNIGTPGRIIKMWMGADTHDDRELMGGRFHIPVRLAKFPNEISESEYKNPIIKEIDLTAVCSHHFAPFGTLVSSNPNAKVIVAYIPNKFVLGISKLQIEFTN